MNPYSSVSPSMNAVSASTSPRHQAPLIEEDFFGFLILQVSEFLCVWWFRVILGILGEVCGILLKNG